MPYVKTPDLFAELKALLRQIPAGRVATCGDLARALGDVRAARWVGHFVLHHPHDRACPCHRVVRVGGLLGGYVGGNVAEKKKRLRAEGVLLRQGVVDLDQDGFQAFIGSAPLVALRQEQDRLVSRREEIAWTELPQQLGGIDVSYARNGKAVAAYTVVDVASGELVWSTTALVEATFPYIPTYLTYRELPALLAAIQQARKARKLAPLTLVDGTGILHPRRLGVATHLGIVAKMATVGVTKSLLCGRVDEKPSPNRPTPIRDGDELIGLALLQKRFPAAPLYVSPGNRVDLATACLAVEVMRRGRRLPEPIHWADRLSRATARGLPARTD